MNLDISGDWTGVLDTGSAKATFNFNLAPDGDGGVARLMTRTYGELALPLTHHEGRWRFDAAAIDVAFEVWPEGDHLAGRCRHSWVLFPMRFERGVGVARPRPPRLQTPQPPFPYEAEEVSFTGADGTRLAGTLTRPHGQAWGAMVLATWYGRVDRDQGVLGHRPFALWADMLTRLGLVTLRYDKRGAGVSGGDFKSATTGDFAADLALAVAFLRAQPSIDPARVGLLGHSEGGHISADVAAVDPSIAFCIIMTPSGTPEETTFDTELFRGAVAVGGVPLHPEQTIAFTHAVSEIGRAAPTSAEGVARLRVFLEREAAAGRYPPGQIEARAQRAADPWQRYWWRYDQTKSFSALACPTLVVFGGRDLQTPPHCHEPHIRAAMAGNPRASFVLLPELNHFLQRALTGAVSEYGDIDESLAPEALDAVRDWVAKTVKP